MLWWTKLKAMAAVCLTRAVRRPLRHPAVAPGAAG
jgi:hypothetical protein